MSKSKADVDALRAEVEALRAEVALLRSRQAAHVCPQQWPQPPYAWPRQPLIGPNICGGAAPVPQAYIVDTTCAQPWATGWVNPAANACAGAPSVLTLNYPAL